MFTLSIHFNQSIQKQDGKDEYYGQDLLDGQDGQHGQDRQDGQNRQAGQDRQDWHEDVHEDGHKDGQDIGICKYMHIYIFIHLYKYILNFINICVYLYINRMYIFIYTLCNKIRSKCPVIKKFVTRTPVSPKGTFWSIF